MRVATANVSDEELAQKQAAVEKLRQQVADAEATRVANERSTANAITYAQLDAEQARLEAQLAAAKSAGTKTAAREAAAPLIEVAKEDRAAAQQQAKAAGTTTGASNPTTGEGS